MNQVPSDPRAWLAESAWVHRLARRLVHDAERAEDLAQDAMLVAWQRPPRAGIPLRAWITGVLRNLASVRRRGEQRRSRREARLQPLPPGEDAARIVERLEVHERLVAAVRGLDEPFRTTLSLRFLDDLSPAEVAARLGVPVKTVHTRIERALARLRERFDREFGTRAAWTALLLPSLPALAMSSSLKWAATTVACAVLGFLVVHALTGAWAAPVGDGSHRAAAEDLHTTAADSGVPGTSRPLARAEQPTVPATRASEPRAVEAPVLRGFVRDLAGRPIAGLEVRHAYLDLGISGAAERARPELPAPVTSDRDGAFSFPLCAASSRLVADGAGYATVYAPALVGTLPPEPPIVLVGPVREYAGAVRDGKGAPIPGAELDVRLADAVAREIEGGSIAATLPIASVRSGVDGRFAIPPLGYAPGTRLTVAAKGHRSVRLELPASSDARLEVILEPSAAARGRYSGRVATADGTPAAGAHVSAGGRSVRCDEAGRFDLTPAADETPTVLRALLPGYQPALRALAELGEEEARNLELVLAATAARIAGVVRDGAGRAVVGARVWTTDGERFGTIPAKVGGVFIAFDRDVESLAAGAEPGGADGRQAQSGADGTFELRGLVNRTYRVFAQRQDTFELAGPFELEAGRRDVVLTLPGAERAQRVAGRVVSSTGQPLAGALVRVSRSRPLVGGEHLRAEQDSATSRRSDAEGRFVFERLCTLGTRLLVTLGEDSSAPPCELASERDLEALRIVVPQRCFVRVELADPSSADSVSVCDAAGRSLELGFEVGGLRLRSPGVEISGGKSERLAVADTGRTLVLRKAGREVASIPLVLVPGEVKVVRW